MSKSRSDEIAEMTAPPRVHDPVLAKEAGIYYLFSTGRGITVHTSTDRINWRLAGRVFSPPPAWTAETIPGSNDHFWAPDISFFNGKWHLYYSVSTFGKNRSAVGLATNVTLNPSRPDYQWKDEGLVVESKPGDDWNAIDPNLTLDDKKQPWLSFGSFWGGNQVSQDRFEDRQTHHGIEFVFAGKSSPNRRRRRCGRSAVPCPP
jgi:arabinan endo-1,5-alpha-L-arabinosidase